MRKYNTVEVVLFICHIFAFSCCFTGWT